MAQSDLLKRYLDVGMALTQLTRSRAESIVKEFVRAGDVQRERAQDAVDELLERSRKNTEALADVVRKELRAQMSRLGLVTKDELAKLEARLGRQGEGAAKKAAPPTTAAARKSPAKKAPAKKSPAKKAPASGA
jgi:polyhydroxyalkanoate synthesis regulator phasin